MSKTLNIVCIALLGATFVFSGVVKAVDPWGFAIKIGEYLAAFGMEWLGGAKFALAIVLAGGEMVLGGLILAGQWRRMASTATLMIMTFFTALTLVLAIWSPVEDCGCFGDAVKLSNWGTFIKNLVLLPMVWVVWRGWRRFDWLPKELKQWVWAAAMVVMAMGVGIYSNMHLPLIDFLPYKVGVNLAEEVRREPELAEQQAVVVVRDLQTGRRAEFDVADTTWYDTSRWEYVEVLGGGKAHVNATVRDFAVIDAAGNVVTDSLLDHKGEVMMVCVERFDNVSPKCMVRLEKAVSQAHARGAWVVVLTPQSLASEDLAQELNTPAGREFLGARCYNIDAITLKTVLRAHTGVVVLKNGVIEAKKNCRDL